MVVFAEIAFIYGGNNSSEKDVFGSEKSSGTSIQEKSSEKHIFCDLSAIFARRW